MLENFEYDLSVVIVNFRTPAFVADCLATLLPELKGLNAIVIVVDNHSADGSADTIAHWLLEHDADGMVRLLRSASNLGFSAGNNQGIRAQRARFYLLLNSDTLVRPGAISTLLDSAAGFPDAGMLSPRLEWPDGKGQESCFRFHTPCSELISASKTGIFERIFRNYAIAMPAQEAIAHPEWTSFACVLVRHEVIEQVGLLDEGYFMYFEDVEYCHRARKAGWSIVHNPVARIVHLRGGSSPVKERTRQKRRLPRYFFESRTRFFHQLYGWPGLTAANLLWWLGRVVSKTRQLLGRADKAAIEREWLDIWTNWLHPTKAYRLPK
jgi:N-acetylglucosaminyl-diphospho-decaprenol L-rhamnosyltransferase